MPRKKTKRTNAYRERDKAAGIDRRDIYIDEKSYRSLMRLLKHAGYDTKKKRDIKQGISGVLLHLISNTSKKLNIDKIENKKNTQQNALLARIASTLLKNDEYDYEDVATIWNQYDVGKKEIQGITDSKKLKKKIDEFTDEHLNKIPQYK